MLTHGLTLTNTIGRASIASFQAVGYEYAVEMTYPDLPEGTSGGLVNFTSQVHNNNIIIMLYDKKKKCLQ